MKYMDAVREVNEAADLLQGDSFPNGEVRTAALHTAHQIWLSVMYFNQQLDEKAEQTRLAQENREIYQQAYGLKSPPKS